MKAKFNTRIRLYIFQNESKLLGKGRIELLEKIAETGSISAAAKSMSMSYRQAWQMVEEMNARGSKPYVLKSPGGEKGGKTMVTAEGIRAIKAYQKLIRELEHTLQKNFNASQF